MVLDFYYYLLISDYYLDMYNKKEKKQKTCRDGGVYDPEKISWEKISSRNAPELEAGQFALWAGKGMLITGSIGNTRLYSSDTRKWYKISEVNAPSAISAGHAVWSGKSVIVFDGTAENSRILKLD